MESEGGYILRRSPTLALLLMVSLSFSFGQAAAQAQDYAYTTNNGTITIKSYVGSGGEVVIPSHINGLPVSSIGFRAFWYNAYVNGVTIPNTVTSIEESAFAGCKYITQVTFTGSVTSIGNRAFSSCSSLASLSIPSGVARIGEYAFYNCTSMASVTIPNSVTHIGDHAFLRCTSLARISVDLGNSHYSSVDGVLFDKSKSRLIKCQVDKTGSYTIPQSVSRIEDYAFHYCTGLNSVSIPDTVTSIGDQAFSHCLSLTNATIPSRLKSLGWATFWYCHSLTSITIPGSLRSIGDAAFAGCQHLNGIYFRGNAPSLASDVFSNAISATVYYLPGTTGWETSFGGPPTFLWHLPQPVILDSGPDFGFRTNRFGFRISWATNASVVVEARTSLTNSVWAPIETNTLTDGWSYFSDPHGTNYATRFYRLRFH